MPHVGRDQRVHVQRLDWGPRGGETLREVDRGPHLPFRRPDPETPSLGQAAPLGPERLGFGVCRQCGSPALEAAPRPGQEGGAGGLQTDISVLRGPARPAAPHPASAVARTMMPRADRRGRVSRPPRPQSAACPPHPHLTPSPGQSAPQRHSSSAQPRRLGSRAKPSSHFGPQDQS